MKCFHCNRELEPDANYCAYCGNKVNDIPYTTIFISKKEAKKGCQKVIHLSNLVTPVRLNLKRGIKRGTRLKVSNVKFYENGIICNSNLYVVIQM